MPQKKRVTEWFVKFHGDSARANKIVSDFLGNYDDKIMSLMRGKNGKPHKVWQCSSEEAEQLLASQGTLQVKLSIWNRHNNYGPIEFVSFLFPMGKGKIEKKKERERTFKFGARPITEDTVIKTPF